MRISLLAFACSAIALAAPAHAEDLVIGVFGGSFGKSVQACHVDSFAKETGNTVTLKLVSSAESAAMIRASGGSSDFDAVYLDNSLATQLAAEGLLEVIDTSQLTHLGELVDGAVDPGKHFVQYQWGATALAYNTNLVKEAPTSWNDLYKDEFKGKVGLPDISGTSGSQFLMAMNRLNGGDLDNMDKGFEAVKKLTPSVIAYYTQPDQLVSMFERNEVAIAPFYPDRTAVAAKNGAPMAIAFPKEGAVGIKVVFIIPKGAQYPEIATKYLDHILSPAVQKCFSETQFAGAINTKADLNEEASKVHPMSAYSSLFFPDPTAVAKNIASWRDRWQREITR